MPIQELDNLRQKFPQYSDMDDLTLATKISAKYPQYSDLLNKANQSPIDATAKTEVVTPFLPNRSRVQEDLRTRPDSVKILEEEMANKYNPLKNPIKAGLQPIVSGLKLAAIPFQRVESAVANPALEIQAGNLRSIPSEIFAGLSGRKTGQLGDIIRTTGVGEDVKLPKMLGGNVNEMLSGTTGLLASVPLAAGTTKLLSGAIKTISKIPVKTSGAISKVRDYSGNKVGVIKERAKVFWRNNVDDYGKAIESLGGNKQQIDGAPLMEKITQMMVERNLYDNNTGKWLTPLNQVDRQLVKSYETLFREWNKTGKLPVDQVVREWRIIKNSGDIAKPIGRVARSTANDIFKSISDQIDTDIIKKANVKYADFRNKFDLLDKQFDIWGNPLETAKGERFLMKNLGSSKEARTTARLIGKELKVPVKAAKVSSAVNRLIPKLPIK